MSETKPSEARPKKMVSRSVALALGIICILLVAIIAYFSIMGISAQNSYNNLQNQNKQMLTWLNGNETLLGQTETWLNDNITYFNSQITNLQNQLETFQGPILGFSTLTAKDNRTNPNSPFLQVEGTIHNSGINGTSATLYVWAYHNDGSVALDTSLPPNFNPNAAFRIDGQSSKNVDLNYYYNGSALASWTITVVEVIII
jgi:archaellum component FlaF (FlaF/FlaG flagellin family)